MRIPVINAILSPLENTKLEIKTLICPFLSLGLVLIRCLRIESKSHVLIIKGIKTSEGER